MNESQNIAGQQMGILAVDDDPSITRLIKEVLEPEGFAVDEAQDGMRALELFGSGEYDLVILDVMMPGIDGFETCRRIRSSSEVPVIFLSAKDEETDKVIGLTIGADDYVTKPFKPREMVARVRARLRRRTEPQSAPGVISALGIEIDERLHTATLLDVPLSLTPKEFDILAALMREAGCPVSAKALFEGAWKEEYRSSDANTVMVHIRRLRKKLAEVDSSMSRIETVFGVGYKIASDKAGGRLGSS